MNSFIAAAAILAATQAAPSDQDVACVLGRLPPSVRGAVVEEAGSGRGGPARAAFDEAGRACASERSWTPEHGQRATVTAAGTLLREEAGRLLQRNGVPLSSIDRWFAGQPAEVRTNIDLSVQTLEGLMTVLQAEGLSAEIVTGQAETIGIYVAARVLLEQMRTQPAG